MADNRGAGHPIPLEGKGLNCNMNSMLTASSQHLLRSCFGVEVMACWQGVCLSLFVPVTNILEKQRRRDFWITERFQYVLGWLTASSPVAWMRIFKGL